MRIDSKKLKKYYKMCTQAYKGHLKRVVLDEGLVLTREGCRGFILCYDLNKEMVKKEGDRSGKKKVENEGKESNENAD